MAVTVATAPNGAVDTHQDGTNFVIDGDRLVVVAKDHIIALYAPGVWQVATVTA